MADDQKNIVISKTNSGFPDYLDFDKLRTEGIDYLGKLSGNIWTDHNVHDPGITMLEMLCYALLDLGYRTNLPIEDLLTRNPGDQTSDNNFFTPAQILTCNPLTITDFRKLLIDIDGVKNAWLKIATDQKDICRPKQQPGFETNRASANQEQTGGDACIDYLNGLYHVYIDLEEDVEKKFKDKPESDKSIYLKGIENKIKDALMSHRNLCEDFIDIYFLCKMETGVCADIEVLDGADAEKVYVDIVERLRGFFSPSPQFYTLPQLLEKKKPIDEIFAGRPYNISESNGFVDTEELEQLNLRKEIHLSDVYNALFEVEGVKAVNKLRLQICKKDAIIPVSGWKFSIPENHVPEFSVECSGFQFNRRGMPVFVDFKKFEGLFQINFSHNGKILYKAPSPYLDNEIPKGVYRNDVADYYSIQNEFPRVYGIAEGGLGNDISNERRSQAYQLKAWLLFFDQLLANYLSQLQHMRSLFALSASANENENHTYFINQLSTVPDLQKLLRFNSSDNNAGSLGVEGTILVVPFDKKKLLELKENDQLRTLDIEKVESYVFPTLANQDTAINQLKNDLTFDQYQCEFVTKSDECIFYYLLTCSDEIALISKKYFKSNQEAAENSTSVKYIGTFDENYRSYVNTASGFSFDIELNLLSFSKYLQLVVENKALFADRRQSFLNHLLARFAEEFTDYAILSFGFQNAADSSSSDIKNKEYFLTHYDDLSSNRGKAYNYLKNQWNYENISGYEKKVKAITGIVKNNRRSLCNFEVAEYENQFEVVLKIAGTSYFTITETFDSNEEALVAARDLFSAMKQKDNYQAEYIEHDDAYKLTIHYAPEHEAVYPLQYTTEEEALKVASNLTGLFVEKNPADAVFESTYIYIPKLIDHEGNTIRSSKKFYPSNEEAVGGALKAANKIDDRKQWEYDKNVGLLGTMYHGSKKPDVLSFINTDAFKIDINSTIVGRPDKFTYDLLDKENKFRFQPANEFSSEDEARADVNELLALITDEKNYQIFQNAETNKFFTRIVFQGKILATCLNENKTEDQATELRQLIAGIVKMHQYFISIDKVPHRWKFNYLLGYEKSNQYLFHSVQEYNSSKDALSGATLFYNALPTLQASVSENDFLLKPKNANQEISDVKLVYDTKPKDLEKIKASVEKLLTEQKEIRRLSENPNPEAFSQSVDIDPISKQGPFVYRLIDKDHVPAFFSRNFESKEDAKSAIKYLSKLLKYGAPYLQLCMGGNIINERKDKATKTTWYHYYVKCLNQFYPSGPLPGKPLILFESAKGYQSQAEAENAFAENYLIIMHLASDDKSFGETISLSEILVHTTDPAIKNSSLVFVPKETYEGLGNTDAGVTDEIIKRAITYPVRMVQSKSEEFYQLFRCEEKPDDVRNADPCKKGKEEFVFYFTLLSQDNEKWQSIKYYNSPSEAKQEFDFFLRLLWYPGNYYVDCDACEKDKDVYRIYLREVLLESAARFISEEQAWGKDGIQNLICVSQTENAFHNYRRTRDCCYSFYVACGTGFIYHPCKYDTPQKRDDALLQLYRSLLKSFKEKAWKTEENAATLELSDGKGVPFATVVPDNRDNICVTDRIALLSQYAASDKYYSEKEGRIILSDEQNQILAASNQQGIKIPEWKETLQLFLCFYPIKKTKSIDAGDLQNEYCIEIKLPGFNTCPDDIINEQPCGCGDKPPDDTSSCYIAWKGKCCYDTCAEAEQAVQIMHRLLLNYDYYQPVFDCDCYSYGIELEFTKNGVITDANITYYWQEVATRSWHDGEIIATNPQCYSNTEMACEAVGRAKELINSEGLHVVEHILLRPRCFPEDCQCRKYAERCENTSGCNNFKWPVSNDDPCTDEKDICFVPGADPYSFIATVALPAWPGRFRKKENRVLIENILYSEAPAHVLLRILWLAPHDFCCFETKYKGWNRWLAQKKSCLNDFEMCDFLEFLFDRNYECLDDCKVCLPCGDDSQPSNPCFEKDDEKDNNNYLSQINGLYCWRNQQCEEYEYMDCDQQEQVPGEILNITDNGSVKVSADLTSTVTNEKDSKELPVTKENKKVVTKEKPLKKGTVAEKITPKPKPDAPSAKRKSQVINSRMNTYRTQVASVVAKSKNNAVAAHVERFLADPLPSYERIEKLTTEILQNKTSQTKGSKKLTKKQVHDLLQNSICYYLDKLCFNGKDVQRLEELKKIFEKLQKAKMNLRDIYQYWNLPEIKQQEPELNEELIKNLFAMNKK